MKGNAIIHSIIGILIIIAMFLIFYNAASSSVIGTNKLLSRTTDFASAFAVSDAFRITHRAALVESARQAVHSGIIEKFILPSYSMPDVSSGSVLSSAKNKIITFRSASSYINDRISLLEIPEQSSASFSGDPFDIRQDYAPAESIIPYRDAAALFSVSLYMKGVGIPVEIKDDYDITASSGINLRSIILASWQLYSFIPGVYFEAEENILKILDETSTKSARADTLGIINSVAAQASAAASEISPSSHTTSVRFSNDMIYFSMGYGISDKMKIYYSRLSSGSCGLEWEQRQGYNRYAGAIEQAMPDKLSPYVSNPRALLAALIESYSSWNPARTGSLTGLVSGPASFSEEMSEVVDLLEKTFMEMKQAGLSFSAEEEAIANLESGIAGRLPAGISSSTYMGDVISNYRTWSACNFNNKFPDGNFLPPVEGPVIKCYGDPACTGAAPKEDFYPGIDIFAKSGTEVKAVFEGTARSVPLMSYSRVALADAVILTSPASSGNNFVVIYANIEPVSDDMRVKAGDNIGTVKSDNEIPHITIIFSSRDAGGGIMPVEKTINPCVIFGCRPEEPRSYSDAEKIPGFSIASAPEEYAAWLSEMNRQEIFLGERFCTESDIKERGFRNLGYEFYEKDRESFRVRPVFPGTVVKIIRSDMSGASSWYGCGGAVFVKTETPAGSFVTAYGGIHPNPFLSEGMPVEKIPTLSSAAASIGSTPGATSSMLGFCPDPHLDVRFFRENYKLVSTVPDDPADPVYTNACGTAITGCSAVAAVPLTEVDIITYPYRNHCAALEWEGIVSASFSGTLVKKPLTLDYEKIPLALRASADDFAKMSCGSVSGPGSRFKWQHPKDALCRNGDVYICTTPEQGSGTNIMHSGSPPLAAPSGANYTCRSVLDTAIHRCEQKIILGYRLCSDYSAVFNRYRNWLSQEFNVPGTPQYYSKHTRIISKFCSADEDQKDYVCCIAQGKTYQCDGTILMENDEITCSDTSRCV